MVYGEAPWIFKGRALYQLQLVKTEDAKKYVPEGLNIVDFFGYTLGGFYLARYDDSPVGAFDELVAMAGLVWNPPTSCAWAARVYVSNKEARDHGLGHVGLPSRFASFKEQLPDSLKQSQDKKQNRSWWRQLHSATGREQGTDAESHPIVISNLDHKHQGQPFPVCTLMLPGARGDKEFSGPRIKMALPSFSGATQRCPQMLKYACDLWTNVRFVNPAAVSVPRTFALTHGKDDGSAVKTSPEDMSLLLSGKPLICMAFDNMEMTVQEPEVVVMQQQNKDGKQPVHSAALASVAETRR